jgi:hypothetical protein
MAARREGMIYRGEVSARLDALRDQAAVHAALEHVGHQVQACDMRAD